jgi:Fe-S oxidoreductase
MAIKAQLFITCLAEQFFPDVLKGMVGLLERLGVQVAFPEQQTCCGQPFFNSGYRTQARPGCEMAGLMAGKIALEAPSQSHLPNRFSFSFKSSAQ